MKFRSLAAGATLALTALFASTSLRAAPVDLALSLVIDVSGSVSTAEYNLQMDGYANAFRDAGIQANLLGGALGSSAVNVIFFAGNYYSSALDSFSLFDDAADINAFADLLDGFVRPGSGGTAIFTGVNRAIDLMLAATESGGALEGTTKRIIDVSGDGTSNLANDRAARDRAAGHGMTINGLPIGGVSINNHYLNNVITADGFIEPAADFADFSEAVRRKIFIETSNNDVPEPAAAALVAVALFGAALARRRRQG